MSAEEIAAAPSALPSRDRMVVLDRIRGAALLLMVLDHVLLALMVLDLDPGFAFDVRRSLTRLVMPAFMIVSGFLLERRPSNRRIAQVALTALVVNAALLAGFPGFPLPEILAIWLLLLPLRSLLQRFPLELAVLGVLQSLHFPVGWHGYEPGYVLLFLALGAMLRGLSDRSSLPVLARYLPSWLELPGRYPLSLYAAHLLPLACAVSVLSR